MSLEKDFHATEIILLPSSANSAMTQEITFLHIIILLTDDSKTVLFPLQESISVVVKDSICPIYGLYYD